MRTCLAFFTVLSLLTPAFAREPRHDWQTAIAHLHPGDRLLISLAAGPVNGVFQSADSANLTTDSATLKREDVLTIKRVGGGSASSRGKHIAIGAIIGGGAGAGIGAGVSGCKQGSLCFVSRGEASGIFAAVGVIAGAIVGALIPTKPKQELLYSAK